MERSVIRERPSSSFVPGFRCAPSGLRNDETRVSEDESQAPPLTFSKPSRVRHADRASPALRGTRRRMPFSQLPFSQQCLVIKLETAHAQKRTRREIHADNRRDRSNHSCRRASCRASARASRAAGGSARHRQGRRHLGFSAGRQLPRPIFLFRRSRRRRIQGALEHAGQQRARLYARRQGDPDAQFRHALFVRRRRSARRAAGDHGAGDRQGPLLLDPVHRHVHVQLRLCGQPRHRQRRRQLSARRTGLERHEAGERESR